MADSSEQTVTPRVEALRQAATIIAGERDATYGGPEDNFGRIAKMWSIIFEKEITPAQVANAMIAMKLSRLVQSPGHLDSLVDIAGYAACGYEVVQRGK